MEKIEINLYEPEWLTRLREEKADLSTRIESLQCVLNIPNGFSDNYLKILVAQLSTMQTYENILQERIDIYARENQN